MRITEDNILNSIKYAFASIIILMGAIGYYRFFNHDGWSLSMASIIVMFVLVEVAIMAITTVKFSTHIKQQSNINIFLYISIAVLWFIASIGIDSTIWHLVEDKYKQVKVDKALVHANEINLTNFQNQLTDLKKQRENSINRQIKIEDQKTIILKDIKKYDRNIRGIIFSVANCNESKDCLDRKQSALDMKAIAHTTLDGYNRNLDEISEELKENKLSLNSILLKVDAIKNIQANFEEKHRVVVDNQKDESVTHIWLMNFLNNTFQTDITNPQRAFVMVLSFIVYPVYILFVAFASSNTKQMKEIRAKDQESKKENNRLLKNLFNTNITLLKKSVLYFIKTRKRKIKEVEVETIKEVEVEVEKEIYKDGKEIVKVEVEKPVIVEQEKIVEKIVQVPVIEKEYVVVPAGLDLNELNKLAKQGIVPKELDNIIKNSDQKEEEVIHAYKLKGDKDDKHRSA